MNVALKRVYDAPAEADGTRILVERLWPRGFSKDKATIHQWMKEIAPSPELRRWFGHRPERWPEFQTRYYAELDANTEAVHALTALFATGAVTFIFAAKDRDRNGAIALRNYLEDHLAG